MTTFDESIRPEGEDQLQDIKDAARGKSFFKIALREKLQDLQLPMAYCMVIETSWSSMNVQ